MAKPSWPYSRLTDSMKYKENADDDPANIPPEDGKGPHANYGLYSRPTVTDATEDVGGAGWGECETFRRINCRGK